MALTRVKAHQINVRTIQQENIGYGQVAGSTANVGGEQGEIKQGTISTPDLRTGAVTPSKLATDPKTITSINGVITLTDESSVFIVNGTEAVILFQGWNNGEVMIRWANDRILKNIPGIIEVQGNDDRNIKAGDVSKFIFLGTNHVRETNYFSVNRPNTTKLYNYEFTATDGQTIFTFPVALNANEVMLYINGVIQMTNTYAVNENIITLSESCIAGEEIKVVVIKNDATTSVVSNNPSTGGTDDGVYDGGQW